MGSFSIWHWLVVLLVIGFPFLFVYTIKKMTRGKNSLISNNSTPGSGPAAFKSPETLGQIVIWFFVASIIADMLSVGSSLLQVDLLQRMGGGGRWSQDEAVANDNREQLIAIIVTAISLGCIISFLMWFYRVRANLPAFGINDARWSPGWAVGWWFVPFFFWFRPYQIAKEIWKASSPSKSVENWRDEPNSGLLRLWWGSYVFGSLLYNVSNRISAKAFLSGDPSIQQLISTSIFDAVAAFVWIAATVPAILVVRGITRRQAQKSFAPSKYHRQVMAEQGENERYSSVSTGEETLRPNPTPKHVYSVPDTSRSTSGANTVFSSNAPSSLDSIGAGYEDVKECPRCAELIKRRARYCRFCQYEYSEDEFEIEQERFDEELKDHENRDREARHIQKGIPYKGYQIRKSQHGLFFEVFELDMKVKGSKDYSSIEDAKSYIDRINADY